MVLFGIERLREQNFTILKGKRVGLMTNPGANDRHFNSTFDILRQADTVTLHALYSPEHGFAAAVPDGEAVGNQTQAQTGLPIYSLYGETRRPTAAMLQDIDVMVCDIQDIGVRFYTYVWTVSYILEACGEHGVEVVILDRPNPLGGRVDGGGLDPEFASFVGRFNLPIQHGMTLGEVAQMINTEWNPSPATLHVISCYGWQRWMMWDDTGLPFVTTSPAMPNAETTYHYPGTCLIEGTQLSEGRGTSLPFIVVGAPYIDGTRLAQEVNQQDIEGVRFRPHNFLPTSSKHQGVTCQGVQAHIVNRRAYRPLTTWLTVILTIRRLYPDDFAWLGYDQTFYERGGVHHFDRLIGNGETRQQIEADAPLAEITNSWDAVAREFKAKRRPYLLYD